VLFLVAVSVASAAPYDVPIDPPASTFERDAWVTLRFDLDPVSLNLFPVVEEATAPVPPPPVVEREREPEVPLVRVATLHRATGAPARPAR